MPDIQTHPTPYDDIEIPVRPAHVDDEVPILENVAPYYLPAEGNWELLNTHANAPAAVVEVAYFSHRVERIRLPWCSAMQLLNFYKLARLLSDQNTEPYSFRMSIDDVECIIYARTAALEDLDALVSSLPSSKRAKQEHNLPVPESVVVLGDKMDFNVYYDHETVEPAGYVQLLCVVFYNPGDEKAVHSVPISAIKEWLDAYNNYDETSENGPLETAVFKFRVESPAGGVVYIVNPILLKNLSTVLNFVSVCSALGNECTPFDE